jgi:hypothetical protein
MKRRAFLATLMGAGVLTIGGGLFLKRFQNSDPLAPFHEATRKVLADRYGNPLSASLMTDIKKGYQALSPQIPYIGGEENIFTEWLNYGVYYLAVFQALSARGHRTEEVGRLIYETYEVMADYPRWFLNLVGRFKYGRKYVEKLRRAARESQKRQYPGDFAATFIEGDGRAFDYGIDINACGICKFYHAQGADKLAPYMCLSDYVISKAFNRGLVRYQTIAEGAATCDFRYKKGRETYVHPLRQGWPPLFGTG